MSDKSNTHTPSSEVCIPTMEKISKTTKNGMACVIFVVNLGSSQNRLTTDTFQAFEKLFCEMEETEGPKACVFTATGKFFSNGLELEALSKAPLQTMAEMHFFLKRLLTFPMPTVAAINGHAFAGGAMISFACDYRVMTTGRGLFCLNEMDIGLTFTPGTFACVRAKVDRSMWADMLLSSKRYCADELVKFNLCSKAVVPSKVMDTAMELATSKAHYGTDTYVYGSTKKQLYTSEIKLLDEGFGYSGTALLSMKSKM